MPVAVACKHGVSRFGYDGLAIIPEDKLALYHIVYFSLAGMDMIADAVAVFQRDERRPLTWGGNDPGQ